MKKAAMLGMTGVIMVLLGCAYTQSSKGVQRIGKDELKAKLGSPELLLFDVRSESDWGSSNEKITGAVRVNPSILDAALFDAWAGSLPKDKEIILYCA